MYNNKQGTVVDIIHHPMHSAPLAKIGYGNNEFGYLVAIEGLKVGDAFSSKQLGDLPEGTTISSLEVRPHSGPKLCRSPGSFATIVAKSDTAVTIRLPSKKTMKLHPACRVTLGIPAGEGRHEKPFLKAGNKYHQMKARGKLYPRTSATAMNAVDHPYGGSGSGKKRPPVSHSTPPGAKVGAISAKRTGRKR